MKIETDRYTVVGALVGGAVGVSLARLLKLRNAGDVVCAGLSAAAIGCLLGSLRANPPVPVDALRARVTALRGRADDLMLLQTSSVEVVLGNLLERLEARLQDGNQLYYRNDQDRLLRGTFADQGVANFIQGVLTRLEGFVTAEVVSRDELWPVLTDVWLLLAESIDNAPADVTPSLYCRHLSDKSLLMHEPIARLGDLRAARV